MEHALIVMLSMLGLRVSEACSVHIEDLGGERGHRTIRILGKGHKRATVPMPPPVFRAIDLAIGGRTEGPVLLSATGLPMTRDMAGRVVKRLCKKAGITKRISPHSLRHSYITAMLDAGVPLRDVQIAARHADPRTTTHYDRARNNLDRHGNYVVAAFLDRHHDVAREAFAELDRSIANVDDGAMTMPRMRARSARSCASRDGGSEIQR